MSSSALGVNNINSNNDKIDSKIEKFENDIKKSLRVSCRENLNEYLFNSSLHGLRYVGDRTITRLER